MLNNYAAIIETDLWDQFRDGNQEAYNELVRRYARHLFSYGYRFYQDSALIEDCMQDLLFDLWQNRQRINTTQSVKGYLFKAMRHRIFKEIANLQKSQPLDEEYAFLVDFDIESKLVADSETAALSLRVQHVLNELPARHREVLYLRFFEGLDFAAIEQVMEINRQSVHNLLQRAYKTFRAGWTISVLCYLITKAINF